MSYIIEANIGIVFMYVAYVLILGNENDFRKQRAALLGILISSSIFPLIKVSDAIEAAGLTTITLPEVTVTPDAPVDLAWIYLVIVSLVALPAVLSAVRLYRFARQAGRYDGSYFIIESNKDLPSWSFFNLIFIGRASELSGEDKELIIKHEMLHGQLLHSLDMVLITILCIVFWFNPVLWLCRRTLAKVHEFEVDSIIAQQSGTMNYSALLAKTALSRNGFLLAHHFNQSFILKRIHMINMIKNKISNWKVAGLGAAVALYFAAVACTEPVAENNSVEKPQGEFKIDTSGEVFTIADESATPKNGITEFYKELADNLEYPEQARQMGIEGKVFVEFIVNVDGNLSDFKVVKGIGAGCDAVALKAVTESQAWNPGKQKGVPIRQRLVLPITFKLGD